MMQIIHSSKMKFPLKFAVQILSIICERFDPEEKKHRSCKLELQETLVWPVNLKAD